MATSSERQDIYSRVTTKILADLEQGVRTWLRPWNAAYAAGKITRPLRHNGTPYQGVNVVMLWADATTKGYVCPIWMTYRQATELGGQVRKGEHGSLVVYADRVRKTETTDAGEETERQILFLKGYTVFNCEQVDGLPAQYYARAEAPALPAEARHQAAEQFIRATSALIEHRGDRAYYTEAADRIQLPPFESFRDAESYYATALHELTHWTKHAKRLARDLGRKRFGDEGYAREELVAELGAAFLCADLGITPEVRDDHAGYIASWLKVLREDKRAIFQAAAHAQRAVDYLVRLQPGAIEEHQDRAAA